MTSRFYVAGTCPMTVCPVHSLGDVAAQTVSTRNPIARNSDSMAKLGTRNANSVVSSSVANGCIWSPVADAQWPLTWLCKCQVQLQRNDRLFHLQKPGLFRLAQVRQRCGSGQSINYTGGVGPRTRGSGAGHQRSGTVFCGAGHNPPLVATEVSVVGHHHAKPEWRAVL